MSEKHRVAITGIGLICPVGNTAHETWHSITHGQSGITSYDGAKDIGHCASVAGQVMDIQAQLDAILEPKAQRKTDRFVQLALIAADEAMRDAGLSTTMPEQRERFGVHIGVGIGGVGSIGQAACDLRDRGPKSISPLLLPKVICNEAAAWISMQWDLQGQMCSMVNACSSSGDAVGHAFRAIRDGYADSMVAGGTESCIAPLTIAGFANMRALSKWQGTPGAASRPFDKDRCGFVLGEGAGVLVLERADHARARGAHIYAEIVGYGASADAYHVTAMHPDGRGAEHAIRAALHDANITPEQVGYINAHGTSTQMNDRIETQVIKNIFGNDILVSSTKSMTGHLLGAAGGLEISLTALALQHQLLPPTINLDTPDPACDLDYLSNGVRHHSLDYAISNSFGFGGGNSVLVLKATPHGIAGTH